MHRLAFMTKSVVLGTTVMFLLGGCSLYKKFFGGEDERRPSELMSDGMKNFERGNYDAATDAFQKLKDRYPYSKYAIIAELRMADGLYEKQEFESAYAAYDEFEKLHPKNENIPYVIYQKGMCNFRQVTAIDRDQTFTLKAREEFERLVKRFPRSEYATRARKHIRECIIYLAEYELYVGQYYYKRGFYRTAMNRFIYLVQNYPDVGQYHEALDYISRCREQLHEEMPSEEGEKNKPGFLSKLWPF